MSKLFYPPNWCPFSSVQTISNFHRALVSIILSSQVFFAKNGPMYLTCLPPFKHQTKSLQEINSKTRTQFLTSRAETNCKGLRAAFRSGVLVSRSERAPAREVSSSEGFCREGLLGAILLRAAMIAGNGSSGESCCCCCLSLVGRKKESRSVGGRQRG